MPYRKMVMNTFLVEALRAYIDNLLKSGGAAEEMYKEGFKWDDDFETWIDPSKSRQHPYDTVYDPRIPRDLPHPPGYRLPPKDQSKYVKKLMRKIGKRVHSRYGRGGGTIPMDILESKTTPRGLLGPKKRKY